MRGCELIESGVLVVRYFGGIKLGTGGLVRAYGNATKNVIANAQIIPYIKKEPFKFSTIYSLVPRFEHFLEKESLYVDKREYKSESVIWFLNLSKEEQNLFLEFASMFERDGFSIL